MTVPNTSVDRATARTLPLHKRIIWARRQKSISQEKLAEQIGTSRRHMIRIEKGLHRPGPAFRARIAEATGEPGDFFEDEEDEEAAPVGAHPRNLLEDLWAQLGSALGKKEASAWTRPEKPSSTNGGSGTSGATTASSSRRRF